MNGYYSYTKESKGAVAKRRAVLLAPFVFFTISVVLISLFLLDVFVFGNPYWNTVYADGMAEIDYDSEKYISKEKTDRPVDIQSAEEGVAVVPPVLEPLKPEDVGGAPVITPDESEEPLEDSLEESGDSGSEYVPYNYLEELPPLADNGYINNRDVGGFTLGEMWATLSVADDPLVDELPVYQGDNSTILSLGVGHLYGSSFPGEGGVCVLAAHVSGRAGHFNNIAKGNTYKKGTQIKVDTAYGVYVYEVIHTEILNYTDEKYVRKYDYVNGELVNNYDKITADFGADELLAMYTCYPEGTSFRTQRHFVIARRIYGYGWR